MIVVAVMRNQKRRMSGDPSCDERLKYLQMLRILLRKENDK